MNDHNRIVLILASNFIHNFHGKVSANIKLQKSKDSLFGKIRIVLSDMDISN